MNVDDAWWLLSRDVGSSILWVMRRIKDGMNTSTPLASRERDRLREGDQVGREAIGGFGCFKCRYFCNSSERQLENTLLPNSCLTDDDDFLVFS